jgi:hypothetical protein
VLSKKYNGNKYTFFNIGDILPCPKNSGIIHAKKVDKAEKQNTETHIFQPKFKEKNFFKCFFTEPFPSIEYNETHAPSAGPMIARKAIGNSIFE